MPTIAEIQAQNLELARQLNAEARADSESRYAGKFVGIANGRVVVVADDLDELGEQLEKIEPEPARTLGFEAGFDYDEPQYIWITA